ncbi:LamG-like jellyroll fold domain-containing protein [Actinomycetota bacterium]
MSSLLVAINPGVGGADPTLLADETWGVVGLYDSLTTSTPAEVMAIEQIGNTIYVGGQFLEVVRRRNEPHHDQPFLAAFDATSGVWIDWWRPELNGTVYALEAAPDGSRLYVGGEFTSVNGIGDTQGLVALDPATGKVDGTFTAQIEGADNSPTPGAVRTIRAVSNWVYIGGSINFVTGPNRNSRVRVNKVARLSAANGTPDPTWLPAVRDGSVWGLDVDESRNRVYLVGFFESINYLPDTGNFIAVRTSDGSPITGLNRFPALSPNQPHQFEVLVDGNNVWTVGAQHVIQKLNATDLTIDRRWFTGFEPGYHIGGDFQSIGVLDDRIYASCHCWGVIRELPNSVTTLGEAMDIEPLAGEVQGIMAFDRGTGDWISSFLPDIFGQIGGWAMHGAGDGCLWAGGDFNRRVEGDLWRNGVVRYCDEAGQGPPVAPPLEEPPNNSESSPPSRPGNPGVSNGPGDDLVLSWNASTDNTAIATYIIYRDGAEVWRTRRTSMQIAPGGVLSVQAVDPSGNVSHFSDPISTNPPTPDPLGYWPLDGGALDMTVNGNHGVVTGALNTPGRIVDAQELAAGDSIAVAANSDLRIGAANRNFTISTWLRLETAPTGALRTNIAANGIASISTAATTRRVVARIETSGGTTTIRSTTHLTLGDWAHVSLVRRGANAEMYVDGVLEATTPLDGTTTAGNGAISFTGDTARVDDVMVHGAALNAAAVADLAAPAFPESLWAYYPLNGDAADHSGNNFNGVVSGTTTQSAVYGTGLSFDGSSTDHVTIADNAALRPGHNNGDFTVAFWMNLQEGFNGTWRTVTQKGNNSSERTFAMWMRPNDDRLYYRISSDQASSVGDNSDNPIVVGEWTHLAYVKRGNRLMLYVNGVGNGSTTIPGSVIANDGDIYIGDSPWSSGTAMIVDDYRIYSHGMGADHVAALARAAEPAVAPPPPLPPIVAISNPAPGDVTKTVKVKVDASSPIDALGTLDVDVRVEGTWRQTTWNGADRSYQFSWDTTTAPPGPSTVRARATDSNGSTTTSSTVSVDVKADYKSLVLADGAVAYWRLNDGGTVAADATGENHRAVFRGVTRRTPPLIGEGGRSATFDGVNDIITVRDDIDLNTATSYEARSIELWFKFTNNTNPRRVLWEEGGSSHGISMYTYKGKLHAGAWNRNEPNAWNQDVFVNTPITLGETYHVVLVVNPANGRLRLFVNGDRMSNKAGVGELEAHGGNIGIGARNGSTRFATRARSGGRGNFHTGPIDEVAIYNVALGIGRVRAHYAAAQD